ncbi:MAG: type II toxin-antitoxin system VapC family toxin, partial [Mariprofundaceae bacterium]
MGSQQLIVLDTHAWIWLQSNPEKLSRKACKALEQATMIGIAAITCWEIAMLVAKQRLTLDREVSLWLSQALSASNTRLLPLSLDVAVLSSQLPGDFHGDPADRMIVATALHNSAPLLTKDDRIHAW